VGSSILQQYRLGYNFTHLLQLHGFITSYCKNVEVFDNIKLKVGAFFFNFLSESREKLLILLFYYFFLYLRSVVSLFLLLLMLLIHL
jgi:hypothetical protein